MASQEAIQRILPHRYPFLMVDRVLEASDERIVAIKNVSANEPWFAGQVPGHAVMPGVLLVEAMAQAGGIMAHRLLAASGGTGSERAMYLMSVDKARFRRPVVPGDELRLEVALLRRSGAYFHMSGRTLVDHAVVAEAVFLTVVTSK